MELPGKGGGLGEVLQARQSHTGLQLILRRYMRNSIAGISLIIFTVVAVSTLFMPAMSGGLVPIFGFLSIASIAMVTVGTKKFKIVRL